MLQNRRSVHLKSKSVKRLREALRTRKIAQWHKRLPWSLVPDTEKQTNKQNRRTEKCPLGFVTQCHKQWSHLYFPSVLQQIQVAEKRMAQAKEGKIAKGIIKPRKSFR